ncbi:MAG: hypothetical protein K1X67_00540 [Fimbriimonadaceae bacterium]|nr:hypothetical protein [Fimbriimonadaceae bacterium]
MLALLLTLLLQPTDRNVAAFPVHGLCYRHMEFYDSPAIVEPVRILEAERRLEGGILQDVVFRIVDADWASAGSEQTIVVPKTPSTLPLVIPSGRRYLLIAGKAQNGKLRLADGDWLGAYVSREFDARAPSERIGLALFETPAEQLPQAGTADVRLALALAECFVPVTGARLEQLCRFWEISRTPGKKRPGYETTKFYTENSVVTERLMQIAQAKRPTDRALMYQTMVELGILGTEGLLLQTLYSCLQDPNAFQGGFYIPSVSLGANPPTFEQNLPDPNRCIDELLAARNIVLRNILIKESLPTPSVEQQKKFARFLDDEDPEVRRHTVNNLAMWRSLRDKMVTSVRNQETFAFTYADLDEKVAWWKQYWREH